MMEDRDYSQEEAGARYDSQMSNDQQVLLADRVIYNDGTLVDLEHTVNLFIRDLREEIRHGNQSL